ncbi:MAG: hypothetical protein Q9216_001315 [Gyalolechia sp. 2 TL-2023]
MDKAIPQALDSLIPEFNGPLPPELLELAISLLAQSRNKASNLKADEGIARSYACAHLACERSDTNFTYTEALLKQNLGLPTIQARPPCPPKVYQKLYRHLDAALPAGARRTARVAKPLESAKLTHSPPVTPRKSRSTTTGTPASARKKRKRALVIFEDVPPWAMPAIRGLCKRLGAPAAPPHVYAGVSTILTTSAPMEQSVEDDHIERLQSLGVEELIAAVYILVCTKLSGEETDSNGYSAQRDGALAILRELRSDGESEVVLDPASVDEWMREMKRGNWLEMDWFENIVQGAGLSMNKDQDRTSNASEDSSIDGDSDFHISKHRSDVYSSGKTFLQPGLGTMMQDRVDYLSDEKRADYQRWRKNILARIALIEKTSLEGNQVA